MTGGGGKMRAGVLPSPGSAVLISPFTTLRTLIIIKMEHFNLSGRKWSRKISSRFIKYNGYAFLDDLHFERLPFKHIVHSMWLITCNNVSFISEQQTCLVRPLVVPCSLCKYLRQTGPTNKHLVNSSRFQ